MKLSDVKNKTSIEVVKDGETGVLIPPADPDAIAGALRRLIENPERAKAMSEKGRADILSKFTGRRYAGDMERLYVSLMEGRRH